MGGSTSSSELDLKLNHLETTIRKPCTYHRRDCVKYCALPNCDKCPYLCQQCIREARHPHDEDGIHKHNEFLKAMVGLIEAKRDEEARGMGLSKRGGREDIERYVRETQELLGFVEGIERDILTAIAVCRTKIRQNLDRLAGRNKVNSAFKFGALLNFYRNPSILACKLQSEQGDEFLLSLKKQLRQNKSQSQAKAEQQEIIRLNNEIEAMKASIRNIINVGKFTPQAERRFDSGTFNPQLLTLRRSLSITPDQPTAMASAATKMVVNTTREMYAVEGTSKLSSMIFAQPFTLLSCRKQGDEFIAVVGSKRVIVHDGTRTTDLYVMKNITGVNMVRGRRKIYCVLGEETGIVDFVDMEQNKSAFYYNCCNQPITYIEVSQTNSLVCCAGRKTPVFIFKFEPRLSLNQAQQIDFKYLSQELVPPGELELMRINRSDLYLFMPGKSLVVYDLSSKQQQLISMDNNKKARAFIQAEIVFINGSEYLVTLNKGEDFLTFWRLQRSKRTARLDQILRDPNRPIVSFGCLRNQTWVLRENMKTIDIYSY